MSGEPASVAQCVVEWRREFDSTFAAPLRSAERNRENLVLIQAGGAALAVRATDITGLAKLPRITPLPSRVPGLLGIIAVRGVLFPAYDLAGLLGLSAGGSERAWVVFAKCETPLGLVFDQFDGQVEIDRACFNASDGSVLHQHGRQMANLGATQRAVIDVPGLVEEIRKRAGLAESAKE